MSLQDQILQHLEAQMAKVSAGAKKAVERSAKDGVESMQVTIATSGTAKSGRAGRIDTGEMIDSVDDEKMYETANTLGVRFGYLNGPYWSRYQDGGFRHYLSGEQIEGTYALSDAAVTVAVELEDNIRKAIRAE